ncbi:helix-turn-helix domain-containing protein [Streptomyces sp. NPDC059835]|uniref:helix-turn-helix domain-containing protein n=1 Tax=Streptomyces sp. NPDC059835 TaxID=3346967 RepID=UPI00365F4586
MAEQQPSAPSRPPYDIRRPGVGHENQRERERYVKLGNHLVQHRELSLTAIGLSAHIQSLPTGADVSIKALAQRFTEGETRIASALRELEAHGYLSRTRERLPSGQVVTRTVSYNVPLAMRPDATAPADRAPAPAPRPVPAAPDPEPTYEPAPAPTTYPKAAPPPPAPTSPGQHQEAADLLARLRLRDPRLLLSERDVARLAPGVTTWLERGITPAAVSGTLAGCLPLEPIRSPAALLAHRLKVLRPPVLRAQPINGPRTADLQVHPLQTCNGCDLAFRSPTPGNCANCRTAKAA